MPPLLHLRITFTALDYVAQTSSSGATTAKQ